MIAPAPLAAIVQHVLETSDNEGAEVLFRQAAIADGQPGSFVAGSDAVRATLGDAGHASGKSGTFRTSRNQKSNTRRPASNTAQRTLESDSNTCNYVSN